MTTEPGPPQRGYPWQNHTVKSRHLFVQWTSADLVCKQPVDPAFRFSSTTDASLPNEAFPWRCCAMRLLVTGVSAAPLSGQADVVDGDTLSIRGQSARIVSMASTPLKDSRPVKMLRQTLSLWLSGGGCSRSPDRPQWPGVLPGRGSRPVRPDCRRVPGEWPRDQR